MNGPQIPPIEHLAAKFTSKLLLHVRIQMFIQPIGHRKPHPANIALESHLARMSQLVSLPLVIPPENPVTITTLKPLLLHMNSSYMLSQIPFDDKPAFAIVAFVWFLPRVHPVMHNQRRPVFELLLADCTSKLPLARMFHHMPIQMRLVLKSRSANRAMKRRELYVYARIMPLQVKFRTEFLAAILTIKFPVRVKSFQVR